MGTALERSQGRNPAGRRDLVFSPGEKHWHGAAATTAMTHIAIVEQLNGKSADWMEKVSNDQYGA
jgi:hypothetical protein